MSAEFKTYEGDAVTKAKTVESGETAEQIKKFNELFKLGKMDDVDRKDSANGNKSTKSRKNEIENLTLTAEDKKNGLNEVKITFNEKKEIQLGGAPVMEGGKVIAPRSKATEKSHSQTVNIYKKYTNGTRGTYSMNITNGVFSFSGAEKKVGDTIAKEFSSLINRESPGLEKAPDADIYFTEITERMEDGKAKAKENLRKVVDKELNTLKKETN